MTKFSYESDGAILILRASGTPTDRERKPVYDAVRADPNVPKNALLLLDVREIDVSMFSGHALLERLRALTEQLGRKLGPVCALIVPPELSIHGALFRDTGLLVGLRVRLFTDEPSARLWLNKYR